MISFNCGGECYHEPGHFGLWSGADPEVKKQVRLRGGNHAFAHTVGVDVLAFSRTGSTRRGIEARNDSISSSICGLDRPGGLPRSGGWLHRQDEVKHCKSVRAVG